MTLKVKVDEDLPTAVAQLVQAEGYDVATQRGVRIRRARRTERGEAQSMRLVIQRIEQRMQRMARMAAGRHPSHSLDPLFLPPGSLPTTA